jgi:hypothetical protein
MEVNYHVHNNPSITSTYSKPDISTHSATNHLIFLSLILILQSHLCLGLLSGQFPPGFPTKSLYRFHLFHIPVCPTPLICLDLASIIIFREEYKLCSFKLCICLQPPITLPLKFKYSSQHPVLNQPQPVFFPQLEISSFTACKRSKIIFMLLYIFILNVQM